MFGTAPCWARDWCGKPTPACAQAHAVRPEQSNATPGEEAAKRYATPSWLSAAATAVPAREDACGTGWRDAAGALATAWAAPEPAPAPLDPEPVDPALAELVGAARTGLGASPPAGLGSLR